MDSEEKAVRLERDGVALMRREAIGKLLGVSREAVRQLERNALNKIRRHREIKDVWRLWKEEGCPTTVRVDWAEQMLEWQTWLGLWWEDYSLLQEEGCDAEAVELMSEIETFYAVMEKAVRIYE